MSCRSARTFSQTAIALFSFSFCWGQNATLSLQPATTTAGGTVVMPLNLSGSAGPSSLQWTYTFGPDIISAAVTDGPAVSAGSKALTCTSSPGQISCVASGLNQNAILDGVVANLAVQTSANPSSSQIAIQVSGVVAASAAAASIPAAGYAASVGVVAPQPTVAGLTCAPTTVLPTAPPVCTVALSAAAPSTGSVVSIASDNANVSFPPTVGVPAGQSSATFSGTVQTISGADQQARVTATLGVSVSFALTVAASPQLSYLACTPTTVTAGSSSTCTATLDKATGPSASSVALASNNANLTVPASVSVPAGAQSATFAASTKVITGTDQVATITGTLGVARSATVTIVAPAQLSNLACTPTMVVGASSSTCTVTLNKAAGASGAVAILASTNATVVVPATLTIAGGAQSATFTAAIAAITGADQSATVTGTLGASKAVVFTITAPAQLASLTCTPTTVVGGSSSTCTATIDKPAGTSPLIVALGSSNVVAKAPGSVSIAAGAQSATFTVSTSPITGADQQATISGTLGVSRSIALTISAPAQLATLTCAPATLTPGTSTSCTATLDKPAGSAGAQLAVASNNANLTVPASASVTAGASSTTFTASLVSLSGADQIATISATLAGVAKTASVTLSSGPKLAGFSCAADRVFSGALDVCTVSLSSAAPSGGVAVSLADTSSALSTPSSVSVVSGATSAQFTATAGNVSAETAVTITAKLSSSSLTANVTVAPAPAFYLRGNASEVVGTANGSTVTPTITAGGLSGKVVARGSGYMTFDPIQDVDGVSFRLGGSQNANTSFYSFTGPQIGKIFKSAGEIRLTLKSNYSFAERGALPAPNDRWILDAMDSVGRKFAVSVSTQAGRLVFSYNAGSPTSIVYAVPSGQEDAVFGKGVTLAVTLAWDRNSTTLYLNGQSVAKGGAPSNLTWNASASMTVGAQNSIGGTTAAGASSLDDVVADLEIR